MSMFKQIADIRTADTLKRLRTGSRRSSSVIWLFRTKAAEAAVEGEDADDAKDKKSVAEVESLEEECDFCVYEDISHRHMVPVVQGILVRIRLSQPLRTIVGRYWHTVGIQDLSDLWGKMKKLRSGNAHTAYGEYI